MPQGSLSISKALSNVSLQYKNEQYIYNKILQDVPVKQDSGSYYIYDKNFRLEEVERSNRSPANMATWSVSTSTYLVREFALKDVVSQTDRMNSDVPGSLDVDTVEFLTDKIQMFQEKEVSDLLFTTTSFSNNATLTTATSWDYSSTNTSAPIQNALSATALILSQSGKRANTMIFNNATLNVLKENNNVYTRLAYTKDQILTEQILAGVFDMKDVYVGTAYYETNQEGLDSTSTAIWPTDCLIAYFEPMPGIKKATAANMFRVTERGAPYQVKKWFDNNIDADYIEVRTKAVPRVIASLTAYLFKTVTLT